MEPIPWIPWNLLLFKELLDRKFHELFKFPFIATPLHLHPWTFRRQSSFPFSYQSKYSPSQIICYEAYEFWCFWCSESQNEPKTVEAHSQSNNHPPIYQAPGSGYQNQEQQDNEKLRSYQEDDEPNEARTFIVYHKLPLNSHQMPGQNSRNT